MPRWYTVKKSLNFASGYYGSYPEPTDHILYDINYNALVLRRFLPLCPYTLSKRQDKHYLSFRDGQGVLRELLINKELFELLNCFELDDLSFLNEVDRHYEHSELTEATLYDRAFVLPESVEDAVLRNMRYEALHNAINKLPETQRRRLILYYFNGLTYSQIAEMEGCKYQTVQDSIYAALNNLKKILK